jgi:hypothetical protein
MLDTYFGDVLKHQLRNILFYYIDTQIMDDIYINVHVFIKKA